MTERERAEQQAPLGEAGPAQREREKPSRALLEDPHAVVADRSITAEAEVPAELEALYAQGLEIKPRSQWQLARQRFFRHKLAIGSIVVLAIIVLASIFASYLAPYAPEATNLPDTSLSPRLEGQHFFGTDQLGRDLFSRVLFGIRTSIIVAFVVSIVSTVVGTAIGAIAGYFGGWIDNVLMRLTDLVVTLPLLAVLLILSAFLGQGEPLRVAFIIGLLIWFTIARVVRGTFLSLREKEFVEAAKALGARDRRIIMRHMLPNTVGPIVVNATLNVGLAILLEAALSFLGFGIQPPEVALGTLIDDGQGAMLTAPWLVTFPGITIVLISLSVNFIGDGLRDALDPTQRRIGA